MRKSSYPVTKWEIELENFEYSRIVALGPFGPIQQPVIVEYYEHK